jgi:DNA-binding NarL/FixJ family response regulator
MANNPYASVRILVVDDFAPWRQQVCSILGARPELRVIAEAADGLEAVQKAQGLQPDLVLLDIGLPKLNGLEVARRVSNLCPRSKILFVSQENSGEVVRGALAIGAKGYVVKIDAGRELLIAVNTILRGEQFVSSSLSGFKDQHTSDHPQLRKVIAPLPPQKVAIRHEVSFYPDDAAFVHGFARLVESALKVGNAVIAVIAEPHHANMLKTLRGTGTDVDAALENGSYTQLDVIQTLSKLMVNDLPDPDRCAKLIGDLILKASKAASGEHPRVAICGECSPTLLAEGNVEAAIRLEHLWNEITRNHNADTLCGYLWSTFPRKESIPIFEKICAEHSAVVGRELGY